MLYVNFTGLVRENISVLYKYLAYNLANHSCRIACRKIEKIKVSRGREKKRKKRKKTAGRKIVKKYAITQVLVSMHLTFFILRVFCSTELS